MKTLLSQKSQIWRLVVPVVAVVLVGAVLWLWWGRESGRDTFRLAKVTKGDLAVTVSATGTVQPEELVDVGAQVAGKIVAFGLDVHGKPIDYGSVVKAGMVLARIDDAIYSAEVSQATAQLAQARANVQRAQADLGQLQAKLYQAENDWRRAKQLGPSEALSQSDFDAAKAAYEVARANLSVGTAALRQAKEAVAQAEATLRKARQNLDYTTIRSPVDGVIIDRRVNIGQTVVASLNAPSLFLIAKDLKRLQIWVPVNEADIGNIRIGQPVSFSVDAFPQDTFAGQVSKIRLNATMTQNVVTYTVEVTFDNSDGRLIPYLTANVKFLVDTRQDVLLVPNAALRWKPQPDLIAAAWREGKQKASGGSTHTALASPGAGATGKERARDRQHGTVWVPAGRFVRPVAVQIGASDGNLTEIQGKEVEAGLQVVVATTQGNTSSGTIDSPFTPKLFKSGRPAH
ncbi:MAG: efflux RND transporter periplasmic adaptor subunit [Desulfobacca sp.]|uniref:efflux RND transporter periplasmic adaptor subunit n=1 Tax=Desulfobacca sp. TaxID=2067990 RepID=UPI00404A87A9